MQETKRKHTLKGDSLAKRLSIGRVPLRAVSGNRNAALLALTAVLILAAAMTMPFVSMTSFGEERTYSLVSGIIELFQQGHVFVAMVVLVLSAMFPFIKLAVLLAATSKHAPLTRQGRERLCHIDSAVGKYSLLDVLVVAVMIVTVKVDRWVAVEPRSGTVLFAIGIALSIAAGLTTNFDHLQQQPEQTS